MRPVVIIAAVKVLTESHQRLCSTPMPSLGIGVVASRGIEGISTNSKSYGEERMKTAHKAMVIALGTLLTAGLLLAANGQVQWTTASEAFAQAKSSKKKIVLDVYTDWCGWCKRMDKSTYGDAGVAAYLGEKYVAAKMNPEKEGTVEYQGKNYTQAEFAQALGISGYPATAFFDEDGELLTVIPGFVQPADFQKVLTYFAENIHKSKTWEEYAKTK
ncbi:MAG: thioredoxin family protein [Chlorobi bacterium CHB2]|nr:thioredoxin family protein [Chlorobi bacterium CHB2]